MNVISVTQHIVDWLKSYSEKSNTNGFVIGISGGIDSAVTSTLCAMTGKNVIALNMPIRQFKREFDLSNEHICWLKKNFRNVTTETVELTPVFEAFENQIPNEIQDFLSMANSRSRLRMITLYAFACNKKMLVAGTGNKVEDFGVGFFTKYGDGGVDISPIADLMKSEVYEIARFLKISENILNAKPTDGLFEDGRTDEDQLGATYDELEWAMNYTINNQKQDDLSARECEVLNLYQKLNKLNQHKIQPVPVCMIPGYLRK
ncbi:MAG: NAD(+) synthase [Bacteroidota bacterium]|jgi:NAD+ synthase